MIWGLIARGRHNTVHFVTAILLLDIDFSTWFLGHNSGTDVFEFRGRLVICTSQWVSTSEIFGLIYMFFMLYSVRTYWATTGLSVFPQTEGKEWILFLLYRCD